MKTLVSSALLFCSLILTSCSDGSAVLTGDNTIKDTGSSGTNANPETGLGPDTNEGADQIATDQTVDTATEIDPDEGFDPNDGFVEDDLATQSESEQQESNQTSAGFNLIVNGGLGSGSYQFGQSVTITAEPAPEGYEFSGWTGDTQTLEEVGSVSTSVLIGNGEIELEALFEIVPQAVLLVANGSGSGTYAITMPGISIPVHADSVQSSTFSGWVGDTQYLEDPASSTTNVLLPDTMATITITAQYDDSSNDTVSQNVDVNLLIDRDSASRFLTMAGLGATAAEVDAWVGRDAAQWLEQEFAKPAKQFAPLALEDMGGGSNPSFSTYASFEFLKNFFSSQSDLRERMIFALSQIFVVGGDEGSSRFAPNGSLHYRDVLDKSAFGNFRTLLEDVTYTPAMARWLTYMRNVKGDPSIGKEPDENYAREILQLFSIGLFELNMDGTRKLDSFGNPIPTYRNEDVAQLARVFTGFSYDYSKFSASYQKARPLRSSQMKIFDEHHDMREKRFLGTIIPAGTGGAESTALALDTIFSHPNVAPFLARGLIQRFSSSHPSHSYIGRVSQAFEAGSYTSANGTTFGSGARGDLESTLAAVLLDGEAFVVDPMQAVGKMREPLLKVAQWFHAFEVQNFDFLSMDRRMRSTAEPLGMEYLSSPSVFNFYRPGYVAPRTRSGQQELTVPELQIADASSIFGFIDLASHLVLEQPDLRSCIERINNNFAGLEPCNFVSGPEGAFMPDYSQVIGLADDIPELVAELNTLLVGGRMDVQLLQEIEEALDLIPLRVGAYEQDLRKRAQFGVLMFLTSPTYSVTN